MSSETFARWIFSAIIMAASAIAPASAKTAQQAWDDCISQNPDVVIQGCTDFIAMDQEAGDVAIAYYNRALTEEGKNLLDAAFADYTKAIELNSTFDYALHNRARIYDQRGDYQAAIADFTKAIAASPIGGHFFNRAHTYMHMGMYRLAAEDYMKAIDLWPNEVAPYARRCRALAADGENLDAARADCDHAVTAAPHNSMFLTLRSFAKIKQADFDGAIADADAALADSKQEWGEGEGFGPPEVHPADALYLKGVAETKLGRTDAGKKDIDEAVRQDASVSATYLKMGVHI
jgi:tetratricopeptide (TPR) repeat protein